MALLCLSAAVCAPTWADTTFQPSVSLAAIYVDNSKLVSPGVPKDEELIGQLTPHLSIQRDGPRLTSALDYSLQALYFKNNSDLNHVYHNGDANGSFEFVPNLFSVEGWASYVQRTIDPTQPRNSNNLFSVSNIADEYGLLLAPYLRHNYGTMTGTLRYAISTARYTGLPATSVGGFLQDSVTSALTAGLSSNDAAARFSWSFDGSSSHTTFDTAQPFRDDRLTTDGSVRLTESLRLLASVGLETDILESSTGGGLNAGLWAVGFKWEPGARDSLDVRIGHRFFGQSYSASWAHQSRLMTFSASYTEVPTTTGQADASAAFVPGQVTSTAQAYTNVLRSSNTYSPYLLKQGNVTITMTGRRTQISLRGFHQRREFLDQQQLGSTDLSRGADLVLSRDVGVRTKLGLSARIDAVKPLNYVDYSERRFELSYARKISATFDLTLQAVRLERSGDFVYSANVGQLTLLKSF